MFGPFALGGRARGPRGLEEIRKRKRRVTRDFYAMGEALADLARPPMYGALGHETFEEMLVERHLVSRTVAYKLIAVVEEYPRKQALELGLEKAYGLVRWAEMAGGGRSPSELAANNARLGGGVETASRTTTNPLPSSTSAAVVVKPLRT